MRDEIGSAFFSVRRVLPVYDNVGGTFAASFPADGLVGGRTSPAAGGPVADRIRRWV
jgi:hypothetical protein